MCGRTWPSILLVYMSVFLLVELIKIGFIRVRRERKRLDGGMVAGERRPRRGAGTEPPGTLGKTGPGTLTGCAAGWL